MSTPTPSIADVRSATRKDATMANDPPGLLWTPPITAEQLGISLAHLYRLASEHRIPFVRLGGALRFDPVDVRAWLDAKKVTVK